MKSLLIHTTPQQKHLYSIKTHEGKEFPLPFHMHERYELTYIVKGKGTRIIGDSVKQYESGDIVLLAPFTSHYWQSEWIDQSSVSAITVFFSDEFPTREFQKLPEFTLIKHLLETAKFGIELKGELKKRIARQLLKLSNEYSLNQIMQILSILNEMGQSEEYNTLMNSGFIVSRKNDRERITKIVQYIRDNISKKISIKELADMACMHSGSVTRFFKHATGFALVEYINLMRIGLACQLLSQIDKTILDISIDCGFNNLSHFNRCFKRIKEITPRQYREQYL